MHLQFYFFKLHFVHFFVILMFNKGVLTSFHKRRAITLFTKICNVRMITQTRNGKACALRVYKYVTGVNMASREESNKPQCKTNIHTDRETNCITVYKVKSYIVVLLSRQFICFSHGYCGKDQVFSFLLAWPPCSRSEIS